MQRFTHTLQFLCITWQQRGIKRWKEAGMSHQDEPVLPKVYIPAFNYRIMWSWTPECVVLPSKHSNIACHPICSSSLLPIILLLTLMQVSQALVLFLHKSWMGRRRLWPMYPSHTLTKQNASMQLPVGKCWPWYGLWSTSLTCTPTHVHMQQQWQIFSDNEN